MRSQKINKNQPIDVEIFAGAGGLTLGLQRAGFRFSHVFEIDPRTCATLNHNHVSNGGLLHGDVHQENVSKINWADFSEPVRLLAAGAPCQPFSLGGRHLASADERNLFPDVLRAVRSLTPEAVLIENVQGLARPSFRPYFEYILRQLEWPFIAPKKGERWRSHNKIIRQHQETKNGKGEYRVSWNIMQAADYGIAQNRRRVFIVAIRTDISGKFHFPAPTHMKENLILNQKTGKYWKGHGINRKPKELNGYASLDFDYLATFDAWRTVRDVISDLPPPAASEVLSDDNHWKIPGARVYYGHSGSSLDWPSKTIKAGVHGVPGGENIVRAGNGRPRYYTLRETARLQGFPDEFIFCGARTHVTRQIGNAVPVDLAEAIGLNLFRQIS